MWQRTGLTNNRPTGTKIVMDMIWHTLGRDLYQIFLPENKLHEYNYLFKTV